jgi:hypothetical protein
MAQLSTDALYQGLSGLFAASLDGMETNEMTVISGAGPEDIIATVWFSLGYRPTRSLVLIGLDGPRRRVGMMIRADLPVLPTTGPGRLGRVERLPPEVLPDLVGSCLTTVAGSGAKALLAVIIDEQALDQAARPVVVAVRHQARRFGLPLADVLGVSSTAFGSLTCPDPVCCPPGGRPIEEVDASRSAVVHVVNGNTVAPTEADLIRDVMPKDPAKPLMRKTFGPEHSPAYWWTRWLEVGLDATGLGSTGPVSTNLDSADSNSTNLDLAEPGSAEPGSADSNSIDLDALMAGFSAALHHPVLRDAVMMTLLGADPEQAGHLLHQSSPAEYHQSSSACASADRSSTGSPTFADFAGCLRSPPQDDQLESGRAALAAAARTAAPGDQGPALAVLALLAWFEGRGSRARLLIERARIDDPAVSLIGLVDDLLLRRIPPPWRTR